MILQIILIGCVILMTLAPAAGQANSRTDIAIRDGLTAKQAQQILDVNFHSVFHLTDRIDWKTTRPSYVVGDLDGDGSLDLVAVARLDIEGAIRYLADGHDLPAVFIGKPLGTGMISKQYNAGRFSLMHLSKNYQNSEVLLIVLNRSFSQKTRPTCFALVDFRGETEIEMRVFRGNLPPYQLDGEVYRATALKGSVLLLLNAHETGTALYWDGTIFRNHLIQ